MKNVKQELEQALERARQEKAMNEKIFKDLEGQIMKLNKELKEARGDIEAWTVKFLEAKEQIAELNDEIAALNRLDERNKQTIVGMESDFEKKDNQYKQTMQLYLKCEITAQEAERKRANAERVAAEMEASAKLLRKQFEVLNEKYKSHVTTVFVTCDKES